MNTAKLEKLMEENNRLLRQQGEHFVSMRALLQVIMVYLPSCASGRDVEKKTVMRLVNALAEGEKDFRPKKRIRKRPKRTY